MGKGKHYLDSLTKTNLNSESSSFHSHFTFETWFEVNEGSSFPPTSLGKLKNNDVKCQDK